MSYIKGQVNRILYTSGAYKIFLFHVFDTDDSRLSKDIKVTGNFFDISITIGMVFEIIGEWYRHPKHGFSYRADDWKPWARNSLDALNFLSKNTTIFQGHENLLQRAIDSFKEKIYSSFGKPLLGLAVTEEECFVLERINSSWQSLQSVSYLTGFLKEVELDSYSTRVIDHFGLKNLHLIFEDPYRLMEIPYFSFSKVDTLSRKKHIPIDDIRRLAGGILWVIQNEINQEGHLFVKENELLKLLDTLASKEGVLTFLATAEDIQKALRRLQDNGSVVIKPDGVYSTISYTYEYESAEMLSQLLRPSELVIDCRIFLQTYEAANGITLSDMQREAIKKLIENRVLIVSGSPGTGKTTLVRVFVHLFRQLHIRFMLMAPTGIAAKRLSSVTGEEAQTIHRALCYDGVNWGNGELNTQAVIVDETSMLDAEVLFHLLESIDPVTTMLIFIGDDAQLPSVGPGNVLRELLACKAIPNVRLEQVFRQAETSDIIRAAQRIKRGLSVYNLSDKSATETEFSFVREYNESTIVDYIVKLAEKLKSKDSNFQVIVPRYEGIVGVDNINEKLRNRLNPDKGQASWKFDDFQTRIGDRLMVIKNNYKLNIFNGDIGKLVDILSDSLVLRIHGIGGSPETIVKIPKVFGIDSVLKLAYAVTVHRCQGEEFETIILPLVRAHGSKLLQRNLLYTAITRARKKVILLGEPEAVSMAIDNNKVIKRNTVLRDLIKRAQVEYDTH